VSVDTTARITISRPRADLAAYLRDPANDTTWIGGIRTARLVTAGPVGVGSRVERVASFLGRKVEYANEIVELTDTKLAMKSVRAPFPMRVTYEFHEAGPEATEVSVRVEGSPKGFYGFAGALMNKAVHRNISRDLRTLKQILES
jgi:uncharacterized membrane protein